MGNVREKGKPIALLFGERLVLPMKGNFNEKGKPIALLFDENWFFQRSAISMKKVSLQPYFLMKIDCSKDGQCS